MTNLHNYCSYTNEYFRGYLNWRQWFLVEEERWIETIIKNWQWNNIMMKCSVKSYNWVWAVTRNVYQPHIFHSFPKRIRKVWKHYSLKQWGSYPRLESTFVCCSQIASTKPRSRTLFPHSAGVLVISSLPPSLPNIPHQRYHWVTTILTKADTL